MEIAPKEIHSISSNHRDIKSKGDFTGHGTVESHKLKKDFLML